MQLRLIYFCDRKKALAVAIALTTGLLLTTACSSKAQENGQGAGQQAPPVEIIQVSTADIPIYSEFPAQTYARNMVEVRGRVGGYIERWLFRPGQQVQAGEVLYQLDPRPYQAALDEARGNLRQSEAELEFARQQTSMLQAEANLKSAEANQIRAKQDYDRLLPLVQQDAASKQDLDAAQAALRSGDAQVAANNAAYQTAKVSTRTQIQANEGKVEALRGAVRTAELNLQYARITAPISGLIGDTQVPVGGLVTPNSEQPLTTIVPLDPLWVRFKISEAQYLAFTSGKGINKTAELRLLLADGKQFGPAGHIENTLNQVDPRTGTLEVQARFRNPDHTLLPGQFGRVRFRTSESKNAILIPQRAVVQLQTQQTVYTLDAQNHVQPRAIQTREQVGDGVIVQQGLKPGDRLIVEGTMRVRPGMPVAPQPYKRSPDQTAKQSRAGAE